MSALSAPYKHDGAAEFDHVEAILRLHGPLRPGCGVVDRPYGLKGVCPKPNKKHPEGVERHRYNHRQLLCFSDRMRADAALIGVAGKRLMFGNAAHAGS